MTERPNAQAFFYEGSTHREIGLLLVHGFSGSPAELRPLGLHFAERGYTVDCPLLPRHGGPPSEMRGAKWQEWVGAAAQSLHELRQSCRNVLVCGLSMGGLVTLQLARQQAELGQIDGIVLMGTPVALRNRLAGLARLAKYVVPDFGPLDRADFSQPHVQKFVLRNAPPDAVIDFSDKQVIAAIRKRARIPLDAVDQLLQLNKLAVRELPHVRVPALIAQGRHDHVVSPHSAQAIYERIGSPDKQLLWLPHSAHVLPLEPDQADLFAAVGQFVARVVGQ